MWEPPPKITTCRYCSALQNTAWPSQQTAVELNKLSKLNFDTIHDQFTSRHGKQILPPDGCLLFLLAPFEQCVAAFSKPTAVRPICLAVPNKKNPQTSQCKGPHTIRRRKDNRPNAICMQSGCDYNYLICQSHRELNNENVSAFPFIESSTVRTYQLFRLSKAQQC